MINIGEFNFYLLVEKYFISWSNLGDISKSFIGAITFSKRSLV